MKRNPEVQLRADEPASAGAIRMSDALLQSSVVLLEDPHRNGNRDEDIHAVRLAIKKVRAMLRLIRPAIGNTIFRRENARLKIAAQLLAPMRDAAVGIRALRRFATTANHQKARHAFKAVQACFSKETAPDRRQISERMLRVVVRALDASRQRIGALRVENDDWHAIELGLEKVYRSCRRHMKRAFEAGDDDHFHRWRIQLKNLYYQLQFLAPAWPKRLNATIEELKKAQELIGDDHDLTVLKVSLQKSPERFGDRSAVDHVLRHLKKRSQKLRRKCQPLAEEILKEKPHRFARQLQRHLEDWRKSAHSSQGLLKLGRPVPKASETS